MTEILESTQNHDHKFETLEQARARIIGEAVAAQTIQLDLRKDNSFEQSKTPEYFTD